MKFLMKKMRASFLKKTPIQYKLTLKRKHNSIAYHKVHQAVAANILCIAKESSDQNLADLLTKTLTGDSLHKLCEQFLSKEVY
jgi:hypothetical protein